MRRKFRVAEVMETNCFLHQVKMTIEPHPAHGEGLPFTMAAPHGEIVMTIHTPKAADSLSVGRTFYVDFVETPT